MWSGDRCICHVCSNACVFTADASARRGQWLITTPVCQIEWWNVTCERKRVKGAVCLKMNVLSSSTRAPSNPNPTIFLLWNTNREVLKKLHAACDHSCQMLVQIMKKKTLKSSLTCVLFLVFWSHMIKLWDEQMVRKLFSKSVCLAAIFQQLLFIQVQLLNTE